MNLNTLLDLYENDNRLKELVAGISLRTPKIRASFTQLRGASINFIATSIWKQSKANHVFVLNDSDEASYFQNDLENLTQALDIFFYPDSFKRPGFYNELNSSHVMLRTEALTKIEALSHKKVLVTYPEALMEKVVNAAAISKNRISIKTGEIIHLEKLMGQLVGLNFKREDFVYEPGQFAMRGGIFDIYSYGNEHPYRIELFGNEVDSIRIFNPETQLSERKLLNVSILPNIETNYEAEEKISLIDYLPEHTVFWFSDLDFCLQKMEAISNDLSEKLKSQIVAIDHDDQMLKPLSEKDFDDFNYLKSKLSNFHLMEWNDRPYLPILSKELKEKKQDIHFVNLEFKTENQPIFNRNFPLLTSDLQQRIQAGFAIYLFAENPKQLVRLQNIFEDIGAAINFTPLPISISNGFIDMEKKVVAYTDHQIFQRFHKYKIKQAYTKGKALSLKALRELQTGDFVSHIDHGVGVYSGLQKIEVNGNTQEAVRIIYKDNDVLYVNINSLHKISKHTGKEGTVPKINKLGSDAWEKLKNKTKKHVKDIASDLIRLYAKRKAAQGFAHSPDTFMQLELESSFIYEDTPDQSKATADVKKDMESPTPMDRLVCGDVGFGKTEVAIRAAFKTVADSKQAAILVPTTILAYQHYQTFKERLKDFPATVDFINRFKTAKQKKETLQNVAEGKVDILIGTHALLSKDVKFKDLGLLVVDEEQKFGVSAKEKLRERKANVDTLTLTATPIPRTLQFSLMAARDLSIINTPPPNRQPVDTELISFNEESIRDAIYFETGRGGQVYFVHNRVQSLPAMAQKLRDLCPDLDIVVAHGQMEGNQLEQAIMDFINHKYDILCCTNIVESGVDISNANTIFINNAHQFGLSDLHQLRGRVGRSNKKAFCYLIAPSLVTLPEHSRKRLQTLEQFTELGSGFQIAMRDLDIRGSGNLLGGEQSGFITDIGFEMYHKILAEAMRELKSTDFKDLFADELAKKNDFVGDCTIDTDLEILIPDEYVENIGERLSIYTQMNQLETEAELAQFEIEMIDRFGPLPKQVKELFVALRCKRIARDLGFEKLILKNQQMRLYFIGNAKSSYYESDTFHHILQYIQTKTNNTKLKQKGTSVTLIVNGMKSMKDILFYLEGFLVK